MSHERRGRTNAQLLAAGLKECPICQFCWSINGFSRHYDSCKVLSDSRNAAVQPAASKHTASKGPSRPTLEVLYRRHTSSGRSQPLCNSPEPQNNTSGTVQTAESEVTQQFVGECESVLEAAASEDAAEGSIKVVNIPLSGRCTPQTSLLQSKPPRKPAFFRGRVAPWAPFRSHADFRFAHNALKSGLTKDRTNEFLALHQLAPNSPVSLKNHDEIQTIQDQASHRLTPYEHVAYDVQYHIRGRAHSAEHFVWILSLKDWLLELILNLELQPHLQFDAQRKFRRMDDQWVRFIDEPWTADDWVRIQKSLPNDGLPLNIELYADKALASSSGAKKIYPVVARLTNLPREIRNGQGVGSGKVVALLPVVTDADLPDGLADSASADYRCAVWHGAMQKLLDTIRLEAQAGHAAELELHLALGLEKALWRFFPTVSIFGADYEEQCAAACIRGSNCVCPCPRCLILGTELHNLILRAAERDPATVIKLLQEASELSTTASRELLREQGYRPVLNAFFTLGARSNIFKALSYDTLHTDDLGRWGKHLWALLKELLEQEDYTVCQNFDKRIDSVPSWRELEHFPSALSIDFSDGSKYQDLLR
ncbi:hypothetical protein FRC09_016653, partial [Ceratobasidium sp. 395]